MKRRYIPRLLFLILAACQVLVLTGCLSVVRGERERVTYENRDRSYRIHVPASYDARTPVPLVVVLHGADMNPLLMAWLTGFNALSDREGFIAVYPRGLNHRWNSGLNAPGFPGYDEPVDDVGFVGRVMDEVERDYRIDPCRIYVTGASNGGMLTHMVACRLSSRVAAAAPVIGAIAEPALPDCKPDRPVPILMINGSGDPVVFWKGGKLLKNTTAPVLSADATLDFWLKHNACNPVPETRRLPHHGSQCGTRTHVDRYSGPTRRSDVAFYTVERGGHTWPGGPLMQTQWSLGRVSRDFKATEVIWQFFKAHPKNE
jgi:polyhydroxybutyrate depolymerase